jgi:hypothetical protein
MIKKGKFSYVSPACQEGLLKVTSVYAEPQWDQM